MRETKVAATLTASLLAPKGEARPAAWRVAARAPEARPWYASLADGAPSGSPAAAPAAGAAALRDAAEPSGRGGVAPGDGPQPTLADPATAPRTLVRSVQDTKERTAQGVAMRTGQDAVIRTGQEAAVRAAQDAPARRVADALRGAAGQDAGRTAPPAASLARIGGDRGTAPAGAIPAGVPAATPADRVRITARLDRDLHRRLKLASAHLDASSQDLIADALSHYLDGVAAGPMRGHCACLADKGARDPDSCGGCGPGEAAR